MEDDSEICRHPVRSPLQGLKGASASREVAENRRPRFAILCHHLQAHLFAVGRWNHLGRGGWSSCTPAIDADNEIQNNGFGNSRSALAFNRTACRPSTDDAGLAGQQPKTAFCAGRQEYAGQCTPRTAKNHKATAQSGAQSKHSTILLRERHSVHTKLLCNCGFEASNSRGCRYRAYLSERQKACLTPPLDPRSRAAKLLDLRGSKAPAILTRCLVSDPSPPSSSTLCV